MAEELEDDRWTYFVTGYREANNELVCAKAGNPVTAEYLAELFRKDGLIKVTWRNLVDA